MKANENREQSENVTCMCQTVTPRKGKKGFLLKLTSI